MIKGSDFMRSAHLYTKPMRHSQNKAIIFITFAQLLGTSLWFSANSVAFNLMQSWHIGITEIGWLTNAVQTGFILGTFAIAVTGIADRYAASRIFSLAAICGAVFNLAFAYLADNIWSGIFYRFLVGISLAGIYPIGMKLAVSWVPKSKAKVLSILVAMLTLGTAFPYVIKSLTSNLNWQYIMSIASLCAFLAAMMIYHLGDPHFNSQHLTPEVTLRKKFKLPLHVFNNHKFKAATLGYFGHMWELYAFWTIVPLLILQTNIAQAFGFNLVPLLSFFVIACGALGCLSMIWLNRYFSSSALAIAALTSSTFCCIIFVLGRNTLPASILLFILAVWGTTVIADSPQFSALSAQYCPQEHIGAALAIQNAIGFTITIISISLVTSTLDRIGLEAIWILIIGPVLGIIGFYIQWHIKTVEKNST